MLLIGSALAQAVLTNAFQLYSQNLSLFAKLFLDTKSVFFDVTTFLYYLLVYRDPYAGKSAPPQVVGFFSKEKLSWDNNNLACILVFPPWQRKGFGQVLMEVSYVLSKREGRLGGPEKRMSCHHHDAVHCRANGTQLYQSPEDAVTSDIGQAQLLGIWSRVRPRSQSQFRISVMRHT